MIRATRSAHCGSGGLGVSAFSTPTPWRPRPQAVAPPGAPYRADPPGSRRHRHATDRRTRCWLPQGRLCRFIGAIGSARTRPVFPSRRCRRLLTPSATSVSSWRPTSKLLQSEGSVSEGVVVIRSGAHPARHRTPIQHGVQQPRVTETSAWAASRTDRPLTALRLRQIRVVQ